MTDDTYDELADGGRMIKPEYDCDGGCGRVWTGQVGWWVTQARAILPSQRLITSATCPQCYAAGQQEAGS